VEFVCEEVWIAKSGRCKLQGVVKQEKDVSEAKTTMFFIRIMMNCTQLGIN